MEDWTEDLFPDALREVLEIGFPPRNPQSIARNRRREAAESKATRLAVHDATLRSIVLHAKLQNLGRKLKRG